MNNSATRRHLHLPVAELGWQDGRIVHNLLESGEYIVSGDDSDVYLWHPGLVWFWAENV